MSFLWSKAGPFIDKDIPKRSIIDNLGIGHMDVWRAVGREALLDTPENLAANIAKIEYQENFNQDKISQEEFAKEYASSGLEYDPNMTHELARYLVKRRKQQELNQYIISKGKGGFVEAVGIFGASVLTSFASPTNIALSFVPIGGQLRWVQLGAKYGKLTAIAAKGAVSGAAFQAGFEPVIAYSRHLERREYGIAEAVENIGVAAAFGASVNALGYGAGRLKDRLLSPNRSLYPNYSTNNRVIDQELKTHLDNVLKETTYPEEINLPQESLSDLQRQKLDLYNNIKEKLPDLFEQEYRAAKLEQSLHESYATGGKEELIPDYLLAALKEEQAKAAGLKEQYNNNPLYQEYLEAKAQLDNKIIKRLKFEQQQAKAYDLSPEDLYTAMQQLEAGKHIDLVDPDNAKSIYETGSNAEVLEPKQQEQLNQPSVLENAAGFVRKHQSLKVGFKEYLRQTELRQQTISKELLCGLMSDLEKAELTTFFKSKEYRKDIARELANLTIQQYPVGFSGSNKAAQVAGIIHHWQSKALLRANRAGADISLLEGYITRQMHSASALREMGYQKWQSFIVPLLDLEKTGKIDFKAVFEALATGLHFERIDDYFPVLSGSSNLAKAVSESRKLHFKSADSWLVYNEQCGQYNLSDSILLGLDKLGKAIGMLDMFGTNPQNSFNQMKTLFLRDLRELAAAGNRQALAEVEYFRSGKADNIFDLMRGNTAPDNPTLAKVSSSIRALKSVSSLGSIVISSLPDMASWVGELANNGIPILKGYSHVLTDLLSTMTSKDKRNFARALGIASEHTLGLAYERLNPDYPAVGWISKLSNLFFRANCMSWWDSSFKSAMGLVLSNHLAGHAHLKFSSLPPELQKQLTRYGINQSNWHLYSYLKQKEGGNYYLIPDSGLIPDHIIDRHLGSLKMDKNELNRQNLRDDLANNLRRYFLDRVDTAIATPHAAERTFFYAGTKHGTWLGEFVRFFMQFKTFPVSYIMRPLYAATLGRVPMEMRTGIFTNDMQLALQNPGTITSMTHLLMGTTVLGYLSISARNLLDLKEPPDPEDPKVWMASVIKGGGLGIFGDFIFNEYDRYGQTFMKEAAGPVFSDTDYVFSIISKYATGNVTKADEEAWKLFLRSAPGRNLFYLQPAINMWMQNQ